MLAKYNFDSTICIIKSLKVQIGKETDLSVGTIDNALCGLVKNKLIYTTERSTYKLNARFAFKGSTIERNKVLKAMLELECPNC